MKTREDVIKYCLSFQDVYEDYPFHNENWSVMQHKKNQKNFALVFQKEGNIWINVKCTPEWRDLWRSRFSAVVPAYHMN